MKKFDFGTLRPLCKSMFDCWWKASKTDTNTLNAYSSHHKKKVTFKKFKGPKKKVYVYRIECYICHKMGHYKIHFLENPRNNKREREHVNVFDEDPPKKNKTKESNVNEL